MSIVIHRGESVGILGRNGSGKSTLLQIIAGTLQPTTGDVKLRGKVAALLELGSGFNPDFTGRENVHLSGAVLGYSRAEMETRFDGIADFADIGDFMDQPVKTYSSGMMMRLAFAVQTAVEPDILIVDEALSVGDAPFQAKCFARLRSIQAAGCTILFVSHDIGTVRAFCQQALWLDHGIPQAQGVANDVCAAYARDCARAMGMEYQESAPVQQESVSNTAKNRSSVLLRESRAEFQKNARLSRRGNGRVQIRNFFLLDADGKRTTELTWDQEVTAVYVVGSDREFDGLFRLSVTCMSLQGVELLSCTDRTHQHRLRLKPGAEEVLTMQVKFPLVAGRYALFSGLFIFPDDAVFPGGTLDFSRSTAADLLSFSAFIEILPQFNLGIHGPVHLETPLSFAAG
ncbi:ABC transporter ATP-binding protein [Horticoccus luteus]|uniref:ABC transporter ATP-binding protein n=1 Tax=Horticoccus luteus TaxID=2862869 RepID=A0A8F9TYC5_9BACT|nr:ABC transporter ATP-binding protein [Horticoccus luteus]QYM79787.1 ABC transporter ATP-binding protein [Horticoccus luteus]